MLLAGWSVAPCKALLGGAEAGCQPSNARIGQVPKIQSDSIPYGPYGPHGPYALHVLWKCKAMGMC